MGSGQPVLPTASAEFSFFLIEVLSYPSSKAYFRAVQQRLLDGHFMLKHTLWHRPCGQGSGVIP